MSIDKIVNKEVKPLMGKCEYSNTFHYRRNMRLDQLRTNSGYHAFCLLGDSSCDFYASSKGKDYCMR